MKNKFDYPSDAKGKYRIRKLILECLSCGNKFEFILPEDEYIVKLIEKNGEQVKWLPVMGNGGYIDLYKKLIPEYKDKPFTGANSMKIARIMEKELPKYTEISVLKNAFIVGGYEQICNNCKSKQVKIIEEKVISTENIDWIKISTDLLK